MRKTVKIEDMVNLYKETLKMAWRTKCRGLDNDADGMRYMIGELCGEKVMLKATREAMEEGAKEGIDCSIF